VPEPTAEALERRGHQGVRLVGIGEVELAGDLLVLVAGEPRANLEA
jgi:hypothetical protein